MEAQKAKEKSCLKGYLAAKKDLKCLNRGQNQYLTAFGIKSLQKLNKPQEKIAQYAALTLLMLDSERQKLDLVS